MTTRKRARVGSFLGGGHGLAALARALAELGLDGGDLEEREGVALLEDVLAVQLGLVLREVARQGAVPLQAIDAHGMCVCTGCVSHEPIMCAEGDTPWVAPP